jgi:pilus assembly protein CpaF
MSFELILPFFRPIEALLLDNTVSEIMGNPDGVWWFERRGHIERGEGIVFDPKALSAGLEVIANYLGKKLGEDNPAVWRQFYHRSCALGQQSLFASFARNVTRSRS